ncbi:MAG: PEP-CTERM sorting domain-containing protein, partial [Opitutales bacterium]|nr:PEP-CTERM sorting domain-containing protein [Opitutales bacterium]
GNTKLLVSNYQTSSFDGVANANLKFGYDIDGNKLATPVDTNGDAIVNNIANLDMYDTSTLNLWLNGTTLNIGTVSQTGSDSSSVFTLMLQDDVERGSLFVQDFNSLTTLEDVKTYISNVSGEDFFVEFANGTSADGGYYIYNVAVPEPAEWAMIFGAIALGFVAYRRRK